MLDEMIIVTTPLLLTWNVPGMVARLVYVRTH